MTEELAWPRKGDILFAPGEDWWNNASLDYSFGSVSLYARGYLDGANHLVEHVIETKSDQDTLVYPVVFLYRQYLELAMKGIIRVGRQLQGRKRQLQGKKRDSLDEHKLGDLWREVREIFELVWLDGSKEDLDNVQTAIAEFESIDPKSVAFRYPVDKKGKPALPTNCRRINLRNLREVMERIANLLNGGAEGVGAALDAAP